MGIKIEMNRDIALAMVSGEIDHHTASEIREKIDNFVRNNNLKELILDFSKVSFMDTSGIGLILGRFKLARSLGVNFKVINIPEKMRRIINLSGIKDLGIFE